MGEAARDIELALAARTPVQRVNSLQEAVLRAREVVMPGDVVLLSPACASFDMFDSFEARGELFREAVVTTEEQPA
jgi:UDP-N-acetylmuramoylalanine--D-glutamate ligase